MTISALCSEPLPPAALDAIRLFNAGEYYKQHDLLEALWRAEPRPIRRMYQGILEIGVAYYQITRGNRRGALKMLRRGLRWLDQLADACQGVDVARLRAAARAVQAALAASPDLSEFDFALLKPVHLLDAL